MTGLFWQGLRQGRWAFILGVALALHLGISTISPSPAVDNDLEQWVQLTLTTPLDKSERWLGFMEVQPRIDYINNDPGRYFPTLLIRPALGYKLNDKVSIWQGYAWSPAFVDGEMINENRIFQQLLINTPIKKITMTNRTRLEQRWFEGTNGTAVRGRHQLRFMKPVGRSENWRLVTYDELFVNLNSLSGGPRSGFEQNRLFAGINRRISPAVNAELGYLNQYFNRRGEADRITHVIMFTLNWTPN